MRVHLVKIDETKYWSEAIQNQVKRIFGVYVYDPLWRVHLCEFTASYELHRMKSQVEFVDGTSEQIIEQVEEEVREAERFDDPIIYVHCSVLDKAEHFREAWFPKGNVGICTMAGFAKASEYDPNDPAERNRREQRHDAAIAEAMEYCQQVCV